MLWSVFVEGQTNHQFKPATFCPFAHIGVFIQGYGVWLSSAVMAWRDASFLSQTLVYSHALLSSSAKAPLQIKRMTGEWLENVRFSPSLWFCQLHASPALLCLTKHMQMISMCWLAKALQNTGRRGKAMLFCWLDREGRAISPASESYTNMPGN